MEIFFFLLGVGAVLYLLGYAIYKFLSAPGSVGGKSNASTTKQNEGQFFDGADGYDATGGYQNSRD